ncbi:cysteinyl-tRNA synthetase [Mycobacterium tuberculosis]|nr:cysteinyl-tRNA synthetase [Mycobacterium tuberculosis]
MLRLYDHRAGRAEPLPAGPGLRVQVLPGAGYRTLVVADLLRRVVQRSGRRVRLVTAPLAAGGDHADYSVASVEVRTEPLPDADVYVTAGEQVDALCLVVPAETGGKPPDALVARLAMLEVPYREPVDLADARLTAASKRLDAWRGKVAEWATSPGRPMNREYANQAEAALADDLDTPGALAVLDRLAADPDVPPGAKLETFIHLDMLLALGLVAAIGSA